MKRIKLFEFRKIILTLIPSAIGLYLSLRYSKECYRGMEQGIGLCLNVLIPSLFLLMTASAYLVKSGAISALCKPLGWLSRLLFCLPAESLGAILLGMIGGYPVGAGCVDLLYREGRISESEARKTAYITVAAGPGFLLNYIGGALLNLPQSGRILLYAQLAAVPLNGVIVGRTVRSEPPLSRNAPKTGASELFVSSVRTASYNAFGMCAMVVVFCAVTQAVTGVVSKDAADILAAFLEITNGCSRLCTKAPLYATGFFIGFGGLSVHFQIFSILKDIRINKPLFLLFRLTEGILTAAATYILMMILPAQTPVFRSPTPIAGYAGIAAPAGSAALVLAAVCFIGSLKKEIR